MIKIITAGSQDFKEPVSQLVKMAHDGLRGNDLKSFVKRAGHQFADSLKHIKLGADEIPVHLIALGATEFYGPNRNGDGFKEATCRQCHRSFVKHARVYKNHENKNPAKSYGLVKLSAYNEAMHRIELLVALNGTKEAAARNGGLVNEGMLQKLAAGKDVGVSMACKVPYDVCAGCMNKAANRKEYCKGIDEGGMCKRGGVANRMCFVHNDGFINHVENPGATYFDISDVDDTRPADRTAYTMGILKAAAEQHRGGAALAEALGLTLPVELYDNHNNIPEHVFKIAQVLAGAEGVLEKNGSDKLGMAFAVKPHDECNWDDHGATAEQALDALARINVCAPLEGFAILKKASIDAVAAAQDRLPGIYGRLLEEGGLANFDESKHLPNTFVLGRTKAWAEKCALAYSFESTRVDQRIKRAAIYCESLPAVRQSSHVKAASVVESLARDYAMYKLAFLLRKAREKEFELTMGLAIRQNYL